MADIPYFTLNTGAKIPSVGMGAWQGSQSSGQDKELVAALVDAINKAGYRHIDTASLYGNEPEVGEAARQSGVPRSDLFITTKLQPAGVYDPVGEFEKSFEKLNVEYIDLWLMHWPQGFTSSEGFGSGESFGHENQKHLGPTFNETWAKMEDIFLNSHKGKVKAIGVSNFSPKNLDILLKTAKVIPAVNQIESHPYLADHATVDYCKEKGIHVTAYSPLGQYDKRIHEDKDLNEIAKKHNTTAATIALSWQVQRGVSVAPKSTNEQRMKQNITLIKLSDEEMERVNNICKDPKRSTRLNKVVFNQEKGTVLGWTMEEMGWDVGLNL